MRNDKKFVNKINNKKENKNIMVVRECIKDIEEWSIWFMQGWNEEDINIFFFIKSQKSTSFILSCITLNPIFI